MIHADTNGFLDRCKCGAVAGFEIGRNPDTGEVCVRARCTDCPEQIWWSEKTADAAFEWNQMMRRKEGE